MTIAGSQQQTFLIKTFEHSQEYPFQHCSETTQQDSLIYPK